jgi:hypothetical protein
VQRAAAVQPPPAASCLLLFERGALCRSEPFLACVYVPLQAEVTWLLQAVNPEVPLNEAALGLIVEEVSRRCAYAGPA